MKSVVQLVKMKNLKSLSTFAFAKCTINEFDAPNINTVIMDIEESISEISREIINFCVVKKNF